MESFRVISEIINTENIYDLMNALGVEVWVIVEAW
jgi:hypothetical protein